MLSEEVEEKLARILVNRIEEINTSILEQIGSAIKQISNLTPSQAYQLSQILKYGGSYEKIAKELARVSGKNVEDIYKIFEYVASENKDFAKRFYKYRGIDFIPYKKDYALQSLVESIGSVAIRDYMNISRTTGIGFVFEDKNGQMYFKNIRQTYDEIIDRAVISISQGKQTYYQEMRRIMTDLGNSGLVVYESGRTRRLDSAVRMNMLDGIRQVSIETGRRFGAEYGANMVEVTHHQNSAPDHIDTVDGKQFARINVIKRQILDGTEKEIKLEDIKDNKVRVKGKWYEDFDSVNNSLERKVGTLNCRHYELYGILGITKPQYAKEQIEEDKRKNVEGFVYEGKHYTLYQGSQLQRRLELEIRKNKDIQILAKTSGDKKLILEAQDKITQLTHKYKEILNVSGLKSQLTTRANVSRLCKSCKKQVEMIE